MIRLATVTGLRVAWAGRSGAHVPRCDEFSRQLVTPDGKKHFETAYFHADGRVDYSSIP